MLFPSLANTSQAPDPARTSQAPTEERQAALKALQFQECQTTRAHLVRRLHPRQTLAMLLATVHHSQDRQAALRALQSQASPTTRAHLVPRLHTRQTLEATLLATVHHNRDLQAALRAPQCQGSLTTRLHRQTLVARPLATVHQHQPTTRWTKALGAKESVLMRSMILA